MLSSQPLLFFRALLFLAGFSVLLFFTVVFPTRYFRLSPVSLVQKQQAAPSGAGSSASSQVATIPTGGTLGGLLYKNGLSPLKIREAASVMKPYFRPSSIRGGQKVELLFRKSRVEGFRINTGLEKKLEVRLQGSNFKVREFFKPTFEQSQNSVVLIRRNLYEDGLDAGIPPQILSEMIYLLSFNVDFQREIHQGDIFKVSYVVLKDQEDRTVDYGDILYLGFWQDGVSKIQSYRFLNSKNQKDYYNPKGQSIQKFLLRTPTDGARLSFSFGRKKHPIYGYTYIHKGLDFATPPGTPIYAAGDGRIIYRGYTGGYGYHIIIRNRNHYSTLYAHMSRFGPYRRGDWVSQRDVIGYIGATGLVTGPHLHYEVRYRGRPINPASLALPGKKYLTGARLALLRSLIKLYP